MIKEKIDDMLRKIHNCPGPNFNRQVEYIQNLILKATTYVRTVVEMESKIQTLRFRLETEDYQEAIEKLDRSRRLAHNSFISNIEVVNRICAQIGIEPIYSGPDDRIAKGDFAFAIVEEYRINTKGK